MAALAFETVKQAHSIADEGAKRSITTMFTGFCCTVICCSTRVYHEFNPMFPPMVDRVTELASATFATATFLSFSDVAAFGRIESLLDPRTSREKEE